MMRSIFQDLRYDLRQLRKSPVFVLTAVSVLALGIGANIAVFTLLSGILLRPLPYPHSSQVVKIALSGPEANYNIAYANMLQLRDATGTQMKMGAVLYDSSPTNSSVVGPGGRIQISGTPVSAETFEMLGVQPMLGRSFRSEENTPGRTHELLIAEDTWRKLYLSDPNVIGKTLLVQRVAYTIIGVMPHGFWFPQDTPMQVWLPEEIKPAARSAMSGKDALFGDLFVRLPDGMTAAKLAANLNHVQPVIAKEAPNNDVPRKVTIRPYQQSLTANARKPLALLYLVVLGIWALASLNVTSLMLTRAVSRTREQAVRAALGATRARLLQQTILESLLLSGCGALAGLLLGETALRLLWHQIERSLPNTKAVHLDWRVVSCLMLLTLATTLVAGVFPALRVMRSDVRDSLSGTNTTSSATAKRTRELLVVGQIALTLVFLVGAGLFLRTIHALRQVPLGFAEQNVLTGGVILNGGHADSDTENTPGIYTATYFPLLERLRSMPGVKVAALSSVLPLRSEMMVTIGTNIDHNKSKEASADGTIASPGLVEALGIPVIRGRFFTDDDTASAPPVAVINQAFAKKYLPNVDPVGHTLQMGKGRFENIRIVGVVADLKQMKLDEPTKPEIFFCLAQAEPGSFMYGIATAFIQVAIKAAVPADSLRAQFDEALHEVAPDATTIDVETIHEAIEDSFGSQKLIARLFECFAAVALMIASVGLYGLLSFTVAQRTREIGVRMALGAPQSNILNLILNRAMLLVALGLAAGGTMAWFATTLSRSYIYGVQPHDAFTFTAVVLVLAVSALVAAWLPAQRAAKVDPILALRSE